MFSVSSPCPACLSSDVSVFFDAGEVPVHCNLLCRTREEARNVRQGSIRLGFCRFCGLIFNTAFDASLLDYSVRYESSLFFSERFRSYAEDLAERLLDRHGHEDLDIIEVGCGRGEFLALLSAHGRNRCVGFDASFDERLGSVPIRAELTIIAEHLSAKQEEYRADLVCCRHVLEHVSDPRAFLATLRGALKNEPCSALYLEVPDALYTLRGLGIWDIIYEHCAYYTAPTLLRLLVESGLAPTGVHSSFGGQFLCAEAVRGRRSSLAPACNVDDVARLAGSFAEQHRTKTREWSETLASLLSSKAEVVVWGAGSKGVTFLNTVRGGERIHRAIDLNPRKQGRYVPGSAQPIEAPESLASHPVDTVLIMNPIYEDEIRARLSGMGSEARILIV